MVCPRCGRELKSNPCGYCGLIIPENNLLPQTGVQQEYYYQNNGSYNPVQKHKTIAIAALILSFLGPLALIGIVLAIVDLVTDKFKQYKHTFSIVAIIVGIIVVGATSRYYSNGKETVNTEKTVSNLGKTNEATNGSSSQTKSSSGTTSTVQITSTPEPMNSIVYIGEEFGNKTIRGAVVYADLDYKDYNTVWTTINDGYKAIYIKVLMTNISNETNYVSVGDYNCYADNIAVSAEMVSGGEESYNDNIAPGRSAILGAMYIVPQNTKSIEMEYKPIGESSNKQVIIIQDESTTGTVIANNDPVTKARNSTDTSGISRIGQGDEFSNKTISGVVTNVNLDYKNYNTLWTSIPNGYKAIYVTIKVTNISKESNYVSVGDFSCAKFG